MRADGNRILKADAEPDFIYYTTAPDGQLTKQRAEPPAMRATMFDFESLILQAGAAVKKDTPASIWYSLAGLELLIGPDARDRTKIDLTPSEPFQILHDWQTKKGFSISHKAIYNLLRTTFLDCLPLHPDLRQIISRMDVTAIKKSLSEVTKTRVSIDRSMYAEAGGAEKLPDILTFTVPVFAGLIAPVKGDVRVAFLFDPEDESFKFNVLPGELEKAASEAEDWLFSKIGTVINEQIGGSSPKAASSERGGNQTAGVAKFIAACPVYRGRP